MISKHFIAMEIFNKQLTSVDLERQLVLPNHTKTEALPFHGKGDFMIPITFGHDGVKVEVRCSCRAGRLAFTEGWVEIARNLRLNAGDIVALKREDHDRYKMTVFNKQLTGVDLERQLVLPNHTKTEALPPFHGARDIVIPITFGHDGVEVDVHCSCRLGRLAFTKGWAEIARNLRLNAGDIVALQREDHGRYFIAMEIFVKKLTSVDIEKQLELPHDTRREALPPFHGARDIVIPIKFGHDGVEANVHCSCRAGRLALTKGWVEIARNLRFNVGDVVALQSEDHGRYKMTILF
ncbi:hypothetical protein SADUNF_Sadunf01G0178900 [Salix dunnii]|uniref:TF-B3 domain-containing protein n=1 Tax=Salix dunnii TaxID=1413687 RepID=A0A835NCB5_9ROSI|nr:hypothetical protein SADUNF_Sadunf01G0178900 [Salix dunnii]